MAAQIPKSINQFAANLSVDSSMKPVVACMISPAYVVGER